jgi:hypothetical protein
LLRWKALMSVRVIQTWKSILRRLWLLCNDASGIFAFWCGQFRGCQWLCYSRFLRLLTRSF